MPRRNTFLLLLGTLVCFFLWILLERGPKRQKQLPTGSLQQIPPEPVTPSGHELIPAPTSAPSHPNASPVGKAPAIPELGQITVASSSGVMVQLQFGPGDSLQMKHHQEIPGTAAKVHRQLEGLSGIYYRVFSPDGNLQVENVVADPRRVSYDYPGGNGADLAGGMAHRDDAVLSLRLPQLPSGARVEIYEIEKRLTVPIEIDKMKSLGSFVVTH